jgi:membrane protein DedA with SNARE-associated domain
MPDPAELIHYWGYPAIFVITVLGNAGLPIPEESVLAVAGYLVWHGQASFAAVMAVAVSGAVLGDNLGYWAGRRYGRQVLLRRLALGADRIERMSGLVSRYGMLAVFLARFLPGVRATAGVLAGSVGLSPLRFFAANLSSALIYVPLGISAGYAVAWGLGHEIDGLLRWLRRGEPATLIALAAAATALWLALTLWLRRRR